MRQKLPINFQDKVDRFREFVEKPVSVTGSYQHRRGLPQV